ncbi:MAG: dTMP kinase [Pseudomonadota bacterium]
MFITLEGGEGSGKSTLLNAISQSFSDRGISHLTTREPGGTPTAERIREVALDPARETPLSALAMALLMNAARADHLDNLIRPNLAQGKSVVCDRFSDSTRAYQMAQGGVSEEALGMLDTTVLADTVPDLTLLLDAAPEDLLSRRKARAGQADVFERRELAFHRAVREQFLAIAKQAPDRVVVLNALQAPGALSEAAVQVILQRMLERGQT